MASVGLFGQDWEANFDEAVTKAAQNNLPVVLVFTGSDWCGPCKKLDKNILQSEVFQQYAKDHYVLYNADFPRKKGNQLPEEKRAINEALAHAFNRKGYFPLVVVLDKSKHVLGTTGYKKTTPEKYLSLLNSFIK